MRKALCGVLLLALAAAFPAAAQDKPPSGKTGPVAVFPETSKDIGDVMLVYSVEHRFPVLNTGDETLTLKVQTSCGCTVAEYTETIPPGGEGFIHLKMEGTLGLKSESATVITNEPAARNTHRLILSAFFLEHVEFVPGRSVKMEGSPPPEVAVVTLRNHDIERPLEIRRIDIPAALKSYLDVRADPVVSGREYRLIFRRLGEIPPNRYLRGSVAFHMAHPGFEPVIFGVDVGMIDRAGRKDAGGDSASGDSKKSRERSPR